VTLLGLAVVLMAVAWLFQRQRRRTEASSTHVFQVLGSLPLGGRDRLHLVQVEQQLFVIGHTPSQITFLSEVRPGAASADAVAPPQPPSWNEAQDSMNAFFKQVEQSRP
jgi:flagellar biosynthetic protein FliO